MNKVFGISIGAGLEIGLIELRKIKKLSFSLWGGTKIDTIELLLSWTILAGLIKNIVTKIPAVISAWKSGNKNNLIAQLSVPIEMYFSTYVIGLFYPSL